MLLARLLARLVRTGTLRVIDSRGRTLTFGDGQEPRAAIRLHDPALDWRIPLNPSLATGEAFMDGRLTMEEGTLRDFLELVSRHYEEAIRGGLGELVGRLGRAGRFLQQF